jgi:hypothetical protein
MDIIRGKWNHKGRIKVIGTGILGQIESYSDIEGVDNV